MKQDKQARTSRGAHGNGYVLSRDLTPQLGPGRRLQAPGAGEPQAPAATGAQARGEPRPVWFRSADPDRPRGTGRCWLGTGAGRPAAGPQRGAGGQPDGPARGRAAGAAAGAQPHYRRRRMGPRGALPSSSPNSWNLHRRSISRSAVSRWARSTFCWTAAASIRKTNCRRSTLSATPVSRAGDLWVLGEHHLLCGDALQRRELRPRAGCRQGGHDVRRPALQRAGRGPRLGVGSGQTRRFCHGVGRALLGGVPIIFENHAWPCGEPVDRRRHPLRLHGLATPAGAPCRRGRRLQRTQELVRLEQEQCRDGLALPLKA